MLRKTIQFIIAVFLVSYINLPAWQVVSAQDQPGGPVYIVAPGDTLGVIAVRFNVTVNELIDANNISDPNSISEGMELVIPGLEGITGTLESYVVTLGENMRSISLGNQVPGDILIRLNRITTPEELYAGTTLIVPRTGTDTRYIPTVTMDSGQTLLEMAVLSRQNPYEIRQTNSFTAEWGILPGETIFALAAEESIPSNPISDLITELQVTPLPLSQGTTVDVRIKTTQPVDLTGSVGNMDLHFFSVAENEYIALTGIYARAETGLTKFNLSGTSQNGKRFDYQQDILLQTGYFGDFQYLSVAEDLINADVIASENAEIEHIVSAITADRSFTAPLNWPVDDPCVNGYFGVGRLYNGSYEYFHNGVDLAVCADNLNIYAVAPGTVAYTGELPIKGNYTLIDHGWGVYSGYAHQSAFFVHPGERVDVGQKIGEIGTTGRSNGPHLHWEMWVNGVQVNPIDWIENTYP